MLFFIIQFSCDFISIFWFFIFFIIYLFKLRLTPCLIWVKRLKATFSLLKHWSVAPRILFLHAVCWVFCRLQSTNQLAFYVCTPLNYTCSSWGEISQCSIYSMFSFILFYFYFFYHQWISSFTRFDNGAFWAGWVVSTLLAGATLGSFTGGALADKFGRTRTFQLDAIPLAVGAFLWSVVCCRP